MYSRIFISDGLSQNGGEKKAASESDSQTQKRRTSTEMSNNKQETHQDGLKAVPIFISPVAVETDDYDTDGKKKTGGILRRLFLVPQVFLIRGCEIGRAHV